MEIIVNGLGIPYKMEVDSEGRAVVRADMIPHPQHHAFVHENMFFLNACAILPNTSETNILYFENRSSDINFEFYITKFSSDSDLDIKFRFDSTYSSGGRSVIPINSNRGSRKTIQTSWVNIYDGGLSGNLALTHSGDPWHEYFMSARSPGEIDFQGALMVGNGKTVSMSATGAQGAKICALSMISWHDTGSHL